MQIEVSYQKTLDTDQPSHGRCAVIQELSAFNVRLPPFASMPRGVNGSHTGEVVVTVLGRRLPVFASQIVP